jgi:hypothetical protein
MTMYNPGQNSNHYNRKQSDIAYHEAQERRLREEAVKAVAWLKAEGYEVRISRSNSQAAGNRGIGVLPWPTRRGDNYLAWTVR